MRIAILLPDLRGGGAESVNLLLAREFIDAGHEVEFVLLRAVGELLADVPPEASVHSLDCGRIRQVPMRLTAWLRRTRPDVLLAAMWPLTGMAILANRLAGRPARVIVSEHNDLRHAPAISKMEKRLLRRFGRPLYGLADGVVGVSAGVGDSLVALTGLARDKVRTIYNPIRAPSSHQLPPDDPLRLWWQDADKAIISIGHLKPQKGYDTLLEAFAELRRSGTNARLLILGEGKERPRLEALVIELGLADHVRLPGFQSDPFPFLLQADLFVLSSRWEGLGNVITEAMACGTPVVSTDCPSGPAELLENGRFGTLTPVDDAPALAQAITRALAQEPDRAALKARAATFSPAAAAAAYLALMYA